MAAIALILGTIALVNACRKDPLPGYYVATPYNLEIPEGFPQPLIPADNPLTVEGVELGRRLFYDERLSGDNSMSCASCHFPQLAFSDTTATSVGIDGIFGIRNAMPIFNLAWSPYLFWDGRSASLEEQALEPVPNEIELHQHWSDAVVKLMADPFYPTQFAQAFGTPGIDSLRTAKALAQFMRTIISADSRYDKWRRGELVLTSNEFAGLNLMLTEDADCFHCHNPSNPLLTDFSMKNNGLQNPIDDIGQEAITGNAGDKGRFKVPSLRNLVFTAPYMHDGRFQTIDQVIDFYSEGVHSSIYTDPLMQFQSQGGVQLNGLEKAQVKAFILALTDSSFISNPAYSDPGY
jgi:cytochrome c peroxidase